jgi:hypothetical protein
MKWTTATDLDLWAKRLDAEGALPELLRFLCFATLSAPRRIDFRANEGIRVIGPDGWTETDHGNAFVPDGKAIWEVSVEKAIDKKASDDYRKRTNDRSIRKKKQTAFVFATLRRFPNKEKWSERREVQKQWESVRILDGDDIEAWIDQAPAVGAWLAQRIGKYSPGVLPLSDFWENWKGSTEPGLDSKMSLESREKAVDEIKRWLSGGPSSLSVRAESVDDALTFLGSVAEQVGEDEKYRIHSRTLIVESEEAWRSLIPVRDDLVLVPRFDFPNSLSLKNLHHHVFFPIIGIRAQGIECLALPPIQEQHVASGLIRMGVQEERAKHLALESGGRLSILRRLMSDRTPVGPIWAKPSEGPSLTTFSLVGQWDESNESDCKVLEAIAGKSYRDLQETLNKLVNEDDSPVRKRGNFWEIISREDFWKQLQSYVSNVQLLEFLKQIDIVLGEIDPRFELPPEERYLATVKKKVTNYSTSLRSGMAATLALIGTFGVAGPAYSTGLPQDWIDNAVRKLLSKSNVKSFLPSISQFLPDIAEASPNEFLSAVERDLKTTPSPLLEMFEDEGWMGGSAHTGLLWALEVFPWKQQYLTRVSLILAGLHRMDPGGRLANRPLNTLREIYLSWLPHTMASLETRMDGLHELARREPNATWDLLMILIQTGYSVSNNIFVPRWRDWAFDWKRGVELAEREKALDSMINEAFMLAGANPERWETLAGKLQDLLPKRFDEAIDKLRSVVQGQLLEEDKLKIKKALRSLVHRHRMLNDAHWALPPRVVNKIEEIYGSITETRWQDVYAWLFSFSVDLLDVYSTDWKANEDLTNKHQLEAAREIVKHDGLDIIDFALYVENPYALGKSIALAEIDEGQFNSLLELSINDIRQGVTIFAHGLIAVPTMHRGESWARETLLGVVGSGWLAEAKARFLLGLPLVQSTWDLAKECGKGVESSYWKSTMVWHMPAKSDVVRAADALLAAERPLAALDVVSSYMSQGKKDIEVELLYRISADICSAKVPDVDKNKIGLLGYHLNPILNILEDSNQFSVEQIAKIEWALFPLIKHDRTRPFVLHRYMSESPKFFVELISILYLPPGQAPPESPDENEVARARAGYDVLYTWKALPGLKSNGEVDQEKLTNWTTEARSLSEKEGRLKAADIHISEILVHSPKDADGLWPAVPIRNLIEIISNEDFDDDLVVAILNSRGVIMKSHLEGGAQEKDLSRHFQQMADALASKWPRTAAILYRAARSYGSEGYRGDIMGL